MITDLLFELAIILCFSAPIALIAQLWFVKVNVKGNLIYFVVAVSSWGSACFLMFYYVLIAGALWPYLIVGILVFYVAGIIATALLKPAKHSQSSMPLVALLKKNSWLVTLTIVMVVGLVERDLGSRGPVEVIVDVAEKDKEDFVVSMHVSDTKYRMKKIAKVGERVIFPRGYMRFHFFMDWLMPKATKVRVLLSVYHPEYVTRTREFTLQYQLSSKTTRILVSLTHWDTKFEEMEAKVRLEPEKALEYRFETIRNFERSIGRLKDSWLQAFRSGDRSRLKSKYESWIYNIEKKYPERQCRSIKDCIKKIDKGTLSEKDPSPLRWN